MVLAGHSSPRAAMIYQQAASKRAEVIADAISERLPPWREARRRTKASA